MNLTTLRRLVWCAGGTALLAAGGAAAYALDVDATARDEKEWVKLFPVKKTDASKLVREPGPKDEYSQAAAWPQGPLPVKVENTGPVEPPPPPDPLQDVVLLSVSVSSAGMLQSSATLSKDKRTFSMMVGECIPLDANSGESNVQRGPWRLDEVRAGYFDAAKNSTVPDIAIFHHRVTMEEAIRRSESASTSILGTSAAGGAAGDGPFRGFEAGKPRLEQAPLVRLVRVDKEKNVEEYELPEGEVEWLTSYASDEAKKISATPVSAEEGGGFRLQTVPAGSRLEASGFKAQDRVISVNGEKVNSTENAIAVGKRQHEGGTQSFKVEIERAGKVITKTYHAPKKKPKP